MSYEIKKNKKYIIHKIGVILIFLIAPFFYVRSSGTNEIQNDNFISLAETQKLYDNIFDLEFDYNKIKNTKTKTPLHLVIEDFEDMIFILLTENKKKYQELEKNEEIRLKKLEQFNTSKSNYYKQYKWAKAEIKLHHAIIKLSFNEKWSAAFRVRQAYKLLLENEKEFPTFIYHKKSLALLQITLASVPKKYQWALDLIGMEADLKKGIKNLKRSSSQNHFFQKETLLWQALLQTYLNENLIENNNSSKQIAQNLIKKYPSQRLALLVSSLVLMKNEAHKTALLAWQNYARIYKNNRLVFTKPQHFSLEYLLGDLYFYAEKPQKATFHYLNFLKKNKSNQEKNFIKDTYYKLFLIKWFQNSNKNIKQNNYFNSIANKGISKTAVDKNAKKFVESINKSNLLPNKNLYQARILTDGGNYQKALKTLYQIDNWKIQKWEIQKQFESILEYKYRKARILDKQKQTKQAIYFYKETIKYSTSKKQNEIHYFAANSALQLGFIYQKTNKKIAKIYFEKAISFKGHQYEESITQKAKIALKKL